jgi:hypothetical protein
LYVPYLQDGRKIIKLWINWNRKEKSFDLEIF